MKYTGARPNEIFLGNTDKTEVPEYLSELKTIRLGETALDYEGRELDYMRPLFIDRGEEMAYVRIMTARFSKINRG